jgi:micrococcal nuclease
MLAQRFSAYTGRLKPGCNETKTLAITVFLCLIPGLTFADLSGLVVGISDGDTISFMHDGKAEKIRLNGIDCPEKGQAFGQRAKQYASELVFNKTVMVKDLGKDRYGRTISDVLISEDVILNQAMVGTGLCWWYRKYARTNTILEQLEAKAEKRNEGYGWMLSRCLRGSGGTVRNPWGDEYLCP